MLKHKLIHSTHPVTQNALTTTTPATPSSRLTATRKASSERSSLPYPSLNMILLLLPMPTLNALLGLVKLKLPQNYPLPSLSLQLSSSPISTKNSRQVNWPMLRDGLKNGNRSKKMISPRRREKICLGPRLWEKTGREFSSKIRRAIRRTGTVCLSCNNDCVIL